MKFVKYLLVTDANGQKLIDSGILIKLGIHKANKTSVCAVEYGIDQIGINDAGNLSMNGVIHSETFKSCNISLEKLKNELMVFAGASVANDVFTLYGDVKVIH